MAIRWAFNPIALARLAVGGAQQDRAWPASWRDVEELFGAAYKTDTRDVFYGSGGAPALVELFRQVAEQVPKSMPLAAILALPDVRALAQRFVDPGWLPRLLPFIVPVSDVEFAPGAGVALTDHPQIGSYERIGELDVGGVSWLDPEQGSANDCYLIAAMIALAWARPQTWRQVLTAAAQENKEKLHIQFHAEDEDDPDPAAFDMTLRVPLDPAHNWIYAHSAQHDETWPALIERAFVMHRRKKAGEPGVDDYRAIGFDMFPHDAARILAGGTTVFNVSGDQGKLPFALAADCCEQTLAKIPTMAWTLPRDDAHPPGPEWIASTLIQSHAYAVLGIVAKNGSNFVVLRNPLGQNPSVAGSPTGAWPASAARNGGVPVVLDQNGVFAVSEERFNAFFRGVDAVVLPAE